MEALCFTGNYTKRFARVKEFSNETVEIVLDEFLKQFCNTWLEQEFTLKNGADWYGRSNTRQDIRARHYPRAIITTKKYWSITKTTNRLGRFFEELKRRIRVFRIFPNTDSCRRCWLCTLIVELTKDNIKKDC